jgi:hypothetical protein
MFLKWIHFIISFISHDMIAQAAPFGFDTIFLALVIDRLSSRVKQSLKTHVSFFLSPFEFIYGLTGPLEL